MKGAKQLRLDPHYDDVKHMHDDGMSSYEVASIMTAYGVPITARGVLYWGQVRIKDCKWGKPRGKHPRLKEIRNHRLILARKSGMSFSELAARFEISVPRAWKIVKDAEKAL